MVWDDAHPHRHPLGEEVFRTAALPEDWGQARDVFITATVDCRNIRHVALELVGVVCDAPLTGSPAYIGSFTDKGQYQ